MCMAFRRPSALHPLPPREDGLCPEEFTESNPRHTIPSKGLTLTFRGRRARGGPRFRLPFHPQPPHLLLKSAQVEDGMKEELLALKSASLGGPPVGFCIRQRPRLEEGP